MPTPLARHLAQARQEAADALDDFLAVLALAGVLLPSVGVDWRGGQATGRFLIDMGAATPETVAKLTAVLRRGVAAAGRRPS